LKYITNDLKTLIEVLLVSQLPINNNELIKKKIFKINNYAREHRSDRNMKQNNTPIDKKVELKHVYYRISNNQNTRNIILKKVEHGSRV